MILSIPEYPTNRDFKIDALKGFAIILVVLGHAIQSNVVDFDNNLLFRIIYSFHMPLFMFCSGYIAARNSDPGVRQLIKKARTLLIPFISWYLLNYLITKSYLTIDLSEYLFRLIKTPDYGLWFLWILFLMYVLIYILKKAERIVGLWNYIIMYLILNLTPISALGIQMLKWQYPFFFTGYLIYRYRNKLANMVKFIFWPSIVLFPVLVIFWRRTEKPSFISYIKQLFRIESIPMESVITPSYKYLVAFLGIAVFFIIAERLSKVNKPKLLAWLGLFSLDIYYLHFWLMLHMLDGFLGTFTSFVIALIGSIVLALIIRRFKLIRNIFFGQS